MSNSFEVFGSGGAVMPVMVIAIAVALVWLANNARTTTGYPESSPDHERMILLAV